MIYSVPGTNLRLDNNMHFYNADTGVMCDISPVFKNGQYFVALSIFGRFGHYNFDWVLNVSKFDIFLEECLWETRFIDIPYTILREHKFIYFEKPVYYNSSTGYNRYRIIPGFCRYAIDQYGNCIRIEDEQPIRPYIRNGYPTLSINSRRRNGKLVKYDIGVHRVMAMTWLHNSDPCTRNVVNHIDANKHNNFFKNLEWTTAKNNTRHAVSHNLFINQKSCKLRNVETGEIHTFSSISRAIEFLGRTEDLKPNQILKNTQINYLLTSSDGSKYEFRESTDLRPWFYEGAIYVASKDSGHVKSQYVYRVVDDTAKVYHINGLVALKEFLDIGTKGHSYTFEDIRRRAAKKYPNYTIEVLNLRDHGNEPIQIQNDATKEVLEFPTIIATMKHLGVSGNGGIRKALSDNGSRVYNGYRFRYKQDIELPWPENNTSYTAGAAQKVQIIDKRNGSIIYADSLREASRMTKLCRDAIRRIIKNPNKNDRYKISYTKESHSLDSK